MTEVPMIEITHDESEPFDEDEDNDSRRPSINDCHTDVEDIDSDRERRSSSLISVLNKNAKTEGGLTDVEDFDDSDDNVDEPVRDYGPEISLNEYLDQGCTDEASNLAGKTKNKLVTMQSIAREPISKGFGLSVPVESDGVTDYEDMEGSGDDNECKFFSEDEKPLVLEGCQAVDIHDSVNQRKKYAPKIVQQRSPSASSTESEEEKPRQRLKTHKHSKRVQRCSDAKSDVENIFFSDEERRRSSVKIPILATPDVEIMAFEGSDNEVPDTPKFPEINISFLDDVKPKKKIFRKTPAPSPMLALPVNVDEGHTDVENLNSSDDDDEEVAPKKRPMSLIPIAVIKSDALTDVEDFDDDASGDGSGESFDKPEVPLPSPCREITFLKENDNGEPNKQTTPLPDNALLGFYDLDADKGLTDVEDLSGESDDDKENEAPDIEAIPDFDGGRVESSDHSTARRESITPGVTPEPLTDCEDIYGKRMEGSSGACRRRKPKSKHSQSKPKSNSLGANLFVEANNADALTDCEDLNVDDDDEILNDKSLKHRRASGSSAARRRSLAQDGKTDVESMSGDDTIDLVRYSPDLKPSLHDFQFETNTMTSSRDSDGLMVKLELKYPDMRKFSIPESAFTEDEDLQCNSEDNEEAAARSVTPTQLNRDLEDLCASQIHEINSGAFDWAREHFEIKENLCLVESQTDIENFDGDEN